MRGFFRSWFVKLAQNGLEGFRRNIVLHFACVFPGDFLLHAQLYMKILAPDEFAAFSRLRELRKELAAKDGVPPFVVFTDEQLCSIVKQKPENIGQFTAIQGIGQAKGEKYWEAVHRVIAGNEEREKTDSKNM